MKPPSIRIALRFMQLSQDCPIHEALGTLGYALKELEASQAQSDLDQSRRFNY